MELITDEIRKNAKVSYNIKYTSPYYKAKSNGIIFQSPSLEIIEKNLFYLLSHSQERKLMQRYYMKPSYLSYDEYGTIALEFLLMYVNNVFTPEDFVMDKVIVPEFGAILEISNSKFQNDELTDYTSVNW